MTVTEIKNAGGGRYKVYSDGRLLFVLYGPELSSYKIEAGAEITDETIGRIKEEVLKKRARLRAMNLLMKHSFTERDLKNKLIQSGYPDDIVSDSIEYVRSFGYIDDEAYAYDYVSSHMENKSIKRITYDLSGKGIAPDVIDRAIARAAELDGPVDELSQIRKLLEKRHYDPETADPAMKRKTAAYLSGKGYSGETIRRAMSLYDTESC